MAQFTNQAQLSYNNTTVSSNIAVGQLLEVLSATKTALRSSYAFGETAVYIVQLVNSGSVAYNGLTLTDDLGAYTVGTETYYPLTYTPDSLRYFINGVLQPTPTVTAGNALTVTGITVPAGGSAAIIYETNVNAFADPAEGGSITNTVTVSGAGLMGVTASETIVASSAPSLSITKSISPIPVAENGRVT